MKIGKFTPALILLLVLLGQSLPAAESEETKRVLILYSEDKDHPAHELTDRGIQKAFQSNKRCGKLCCNLSICPFKPALKGAAALFV